MGMHLRKLVVLSTVEHVPCHTLLQACVSTHGSRQHCGGVNGAWRPVSGQLRQTFVAAATPSIHPSIHSNIRVIRASHGLAYG
eukprot:365569-Chlamydomonas_euryale.AAC.5